MKIQVLQENLIKALSLTGKFASSKAQLPVLGNIMLSAQKNKVLVCSTNLEVSVAIWIGAKVEVDGKLTVPARVIIELISNIPSGTIEIESEKEQLKISTPNSSLVVSGMNASDFPSVPLSLGKENVISLPKETFIQALSKVIFATSIDEARPLLTGVLFIFGSKELTLVATDGFRLSQKKIVFPSDQKIDKVTLPKAALSEIGRLSEGEESLSFSFNKGENQAVFGIGDIVLSTRTLEGEFPDFEKIIPKSTVYKISVDKEDLQRTVKLASVFSRDSANIVRIKLEDGFLGISGESQSGSQRGKIEAKIEGPERPTGGEEFEMAFNYRFLEELLHVVSGDEVQIELSDADKPGLFTDPKDPDFLHLIMPVSIQS